MIIARDNLSLGQAEEANAYNIVLSGTEEECRRFLADHEGDPSLVLLTEEEYDNNQQAFRGV